MKLAPVQPGRAALLRPALHSRVMVVTLGALVAIDVVFLGLHLAHVAAEWRGGGALAGRAFSIETEGGASEIYEFAKASICVGGLWLCAVRTAQPVYAALSGAFGLALLDNALMLHERTGGLLAPALVSATAWFQAAPQALGELCFFAVAGGAILVLLAIGFRRSLRPHRRAGAAFVMLLMMLGGFGVALDMFHAMVGGQRRAVDRIFGAIEDGGELMVLSVAAALAVALQARLAARPWDEA